MSAARRNAGLVGAATALLFFAVIIASRMYALTTIISANAISVRPGDYALAAAWAMVLCGILFFMPVEAAERGALTAVWTIKAAVSLGLMWFYERHYGKALDAYGYFSCAANPRFTFRGLEYGSRDNLLIELIHLHTLIIPNSYDAVKIGFSFIGLIAVFLFYRAAVIFLAKDDIRIFYILALYPAILFWSSILGKEPITFLGMALFAYGAVGSWRRGGLKHFAAVFAGMLFVGVIRIWLVYIMVLSLAVMFVITKGKKLCVKAVFVADVLVGLFLVLNRTVSRTFGVRSGAAPGTSLETVGEMLNLRSRLANTAFSGGGSSLQPPAIHSLHGLILHAPAAVFDAFFRPLPGDVKGIWGLLGSIDGVVLPALLLIAVTRTRLKEIKDPLIIGAILFLFAWGGMYGLTVYNYGALVRYRLQILPMFLLLLLYLSRKRPKVG